MNVKSDPHRRLSFLSIFFLTGRLNCNNAQLTSLAENAVECSTESLLGRNAGVASLNEQHKGNVFFCVIEAHAYSGFIKV